MQYINLFRQIFLEILIIRSRTAAEQKEEEKQTYSNERELYLKFKYE